MKSHRQAQPSEKKLSLETDSDTLEESVALLVEELASIGCPWEEIAAYLSCPPDMLQRQYGPHMRLGLARRNVGLRRAQYETAKAGSVPMQVWLGRQWLNQREEPLPEGGNNALDALLAEFRKQREELKNADAAPKERE